MFHPTFVLKGKDTLLAILRQAAGGSKYWSWAFKNVGTVDAVQKIGRQPLDRMLDKKKKHQDDLPVVVRDIKTDKGC